MYDLIIAYGDAKDFVEAKRWLVERGFVGREYDPTGHERVVSKGGSGDSFRPLLDERLTRRFPFIDLDGKLAYESVRFDGLDPDTRAPAKRFVIRRRAKPGESIRRWVPQASGAKEAVWVPAQGGEWVYKTDDIVRIPYRLPQLRQAAERGLSAWNPEGEGKADAIAALDLVGTSNAGGANWAYPLSWPEHFRGVRGVIFPNDCDKPGRFSAAIRAKLFLDAGIPATVFDIAPERMDAYDIKDWIEERKRVPKRQIVAELRALYLQRMREQRVSDIVLDATVPAIGLTSEGL